MRILHTCLRYPPATGGVETYVREIVERTRDASPANDVRVLTSKLRTHGPVSELAAELLLDDPMYVQRLHHAATPFISYPRLQALSYYIGHHQPDILHGYSFWYQPADTAARFTRRSLGEDGHRVPFIFHPIYYENDIRRKPVWQLYKHTIGRQTFAAADVVAVISPYEQKLIEAASFSVKRFELLPPGVDAAELSSPAPNPFAVRHIRGRILLTVSRLAPGKGLEDVLAAMPDIVKEVPTVQLVIAGEDFGALPALQEQARLLGLKNHIHWLGKLSRSDLIGAYQHADVFVHPSHYEAFGIVIAEALAAGTPVVARNTAAIPFVAPHGTAGLLFNSQQELTGSILRMLADAALAASLARAGGQRVRHEFSWDATIKKLAALYDEFGQRASSSRF